MFDIDIMETLLTVPGILLGFVFHEFAHAITADRLGDNTPRLQGKLTLDPRAHIDIIGFIMILIVHFGWAKPVVTNPRNYKHPRRDDILVSIAGPFMNLIIAIVFYLLIKIISVTSFISSFGSMQQNLYLLLSYTANINVVLFVLNLLPIPYFDGYHVIANIFNTWKYRFFNILEQYNMIIFILLVVTGVLGKILNPLISIVNNFLVSIIF